MRPMIHEALRATLRRHALSVVLAALALAVALGGAPWRIALRWERAALEAGAWWRLVSGQLAHLGITHLVLNLAGLALVSALYAGPLGGWRGVVVTTLSALAVGLGLWWGEPGLGWYVGLSGLLHGLILAGALGTLGARRGESLLVIALVMAKLVWESAIGPLPGTAGLAGGPVITAAHTYGALGGALAAGLLDVCDRYRARMQV